MCSCVEMITVLIVVGIWGDKRFCVSHGLCDTTVYEQYVCVCVCLGERVTMKRKTKLILWL